MTKVRVSFVLDTKKLGFEEGRTASGLVSGLLAPARASHIAAQTLVRADGALSQEDKVQRIAKALRGIALSLMAEANLTVEEVPDNTAVEMILPFERADATI